MDACVLHTAVYVLLTTGMLEGANNFSIAVALILITVWRESKLRGTEKQMWRGW